MKDSMYNFRQLAKQNPKFIVSWMQLARISTISARSFFALLEMFGHPAEVLLHLGDMAKKVTNNKSTLKIPSEIDIQHEMQQYEKMEVHVICAFHEQYPEALLAISDPPPVIIARGRREIIACDKKIAIIGARNASLNAIKLAENFARELSQAGYVIVSGMARGIDAAAHRATCDYNTIGVIASGIDVMYPKENKMLFDLLYEQGLIITELKVGCKPLPQYFPQRNRIISGLCSGVVVMEAAKKSGTLITARFAMEQGRDIFAIPGSPFDIRHSGTNALIKNGAILVETADDVLKALTTFHSNQQEYLFDHKKYFTDYRMKAIPSEQELTKHREKIFALISYEPVSIEAIAKYLQIEIAVVNFLILELEVAGIVERSYGNGVKRIAHVV